MSRAVTLAAVTAALVLNAGSLFLVVKVARALPARSAATATATATGLVATPRAIVDDHVRLGVEDDVASKNAPDTPVRARHVAAAPAPTATTTLPSALVQETFRARVGRQLETLPLCRRSDGPEGRGIAEVTFAPDGKVNVQVGAPFARTEAGACVARRLAGAAEPFDGVRDVTVRVPFEL